MKSFAPSPPIFDFFFFNTVILYSNSTTRPLRLVSNFFVFFCSMLPARKREALTPRSPNEQIPLAPAFKAKARKPGMIEQFVSVFDTIGSASSNGNKGEEERGGGEQRPSTRRKKKKKKSKSESLTNSSKKRKAQRRARSTIVADDFGMTVVIQSPDTPLDPDSSSPIERRASGGGSRGSNKNMSVDTTLQVDGETMATIPLTNSPERKPSKRAVRSNYDTMSNYVKENLSMATASDTPKGGAFMKSSSTSSRAAGVPKKPGFIVPKRTRTQQQEAAQPPPPHPGIRPTSKLKLSLKKDEVMINTEYILKQQSTPLTFKRPSPMERSTPVMFKKPSPMERGKSPGIRAGGYSIPTSASPSFPFSPADDGMIVEERRLESVSEHMSAKLANKKNRKARANTNNNNISMSPSPMQAFRKMITPPSIKKIIMQRSMKSKRKERKTKAVSSTKVVPPTKAASTAPAPAPAPASTLASASVSAPILKSSVSPCLAVGTITPTPSTAPTNRLLKLMTLFLIVALIALSCGKFIQPPAPDDFAAGISGKAAKENLVSYPESGTPRAPNRGGKISKKSAKIATPHYAPYRGGTKSAIKTGKSAKWFDQTRTSNQQNFNSMLEEKGLRIGAQEKNEQIVVVVHGKGVIPYSVKEKLRKFGGGSGRIFVNVLKLGLITFAGDVLAKTAGSSPLLRFAGSMFRKYGRTFFAKMVIKLDFLRGKIIASKFAVALGDFLKANVLKKW